MERDNIQPIEGIIKPQNNSENIPALWIPIHDWIDEVFVYFESKKNYIFAQILI